MVTESASLMPWLSFGEDGKGFKPRRGQQAVADWIIKNPDERTLTAKMPGGYGKSIAIAMAYAVKRRLGQVDRLLIVVANDTQMAQVKDDFAGDCVCIGAPIIGTWPFNNEPSVAKVLLLGKADVFIVNIQTVSSTARNPIDTLLALLNTRGYRWMLAADEYHHYAEERDWGLSLKRVHDACVFTLALSATPDRDGTPTIFGNPKITVTYEEGVAEKALKRIELKSYHYLVDLIDLKKEIIRISTEDIRDNGETVSETINIYSARRELRFSNKYVSPLLVRPLLRLHEARMRTDKPLQMLVRAVTCKHAQSLVEQVRGLSGGNLTVDWVGTGPDGRADDVNNAIKRKFCPRKEGLTRADPELDVLVQVAMAGEGFDSIFVTEVVDLALATLRGSSNQTKQFYLRGSRWITGLPESEQILTINLPTDHPATNKDLIACLMAWVDSAAPLPDSPGEFTDPSEDRLMPPIDVNAIMEGLMRQIEGVDFQGVDLYPDPCSPGFTRSVRKLNRDLTARGYPALDYMNNSDDLAYARQVYCAGMSAHHGEISESDRLDRNRGIANTYVKRLVNFGLQSRARVAGIPLALPTDTFVSSLKRCNSRITELFGERNAMMVEDVRLLLEQLKVWHGDIASGKFPSWL